MKVEFFAIAEQELLEAASHYEKCASGLGNDFVREVERVVRVMSEFPSLGEKLDSRHRRIPLRRFPYALILRCDREAIRVVAVAHRRRRPRYWSPRVQDR